MSEAVYPNDWQERRLTGLANYHNGLAFKPADWSEDGVRIIRIEQLNNPEGDYDHFNGFFPDANAINDGDLIFSWSATLKVSIWRYGKAVLNQHLFKVVPKSGFDKSYLYFLLDFHMDALSAGSHGSTMKHIKRGELEKYSVRLPSQREQEKIAEVLATIDSAIEKTESLIAKYQQIKAGLMHDLFTRGVTAAGKLRPPRVQAPDLYKESPLGWIPKEWEYCILKELYKNPIRDFGSFSSTNLITFLSDGVPFIKSEMIREGEINWSSVSFISEKVHLLLRKSHVAKGHILFSKIGSALGKAVIYDGKRGICNSNAAVAKIEINENLALTKYVEMFLNSAFARSQFRAIIISLLPRINLGDIDKLEIPVPSITEQKILSQVIVSTDAKIASEKECLSKLLNKKRGLMDDILTGCVRVPEPPDLTV